MLSLHTADAQICDMRRPMRAVALEPAFAKRSTHRFLTGGLAGVLTMHEKGWLGNKEQAVHSGDGAIWCIEWQGGYAAWATDKVRRCSW